jgi:hypothetical protein
LLRQQQQRGHDQRDPRKLRQVACDPQRISGVFGKGRGRLVRVGAHRVQIGRDEKQDTSGDCAGRSHLACAAGHHPLCLSLCGALSRGMLDERQTEKTAAVVQEILKIESQFSPSGHRRRMRVLNAA